MFDAAAGRSGIGREETVSELGLDLIAIVVAAVAAFAFGAVFYTALGKHWMDAADLTEDSVKKRSAVPFITSFVGLLIMGFVLSWHFGRQGSDVSAAVALHSSLVLWLGFIVTTMATNNAFRQSKAKLTVIDSLHWLGVIVIEALVISAF